MDSIVAGYLNGESGAGRSASERVFFFSPFPPAHFVGPTVSRAIMLTGSSVDLENQENVPPGVKEVPKVAGAAGHRLALGLLQANQRRSQPQVRRFALLRLAWTGSPSPWPKSRHPSAPLHPRTRHFGAFFSSS